MGEISPSIKSTQQARQERAQKEIEDSSHSQSLSDIKKNAQIVRGRAEEDSVTNNENLATSYKAKLNNKSYTHDLKIKTKKSLFGAKVKRRWVPNQGKINALKAKLSNALNNAEEARGKAVIHQIKKGEFGNLADKFASKTNKARGKLARSKEVERVFSHTGLDKVFDKKTLAAIKKDGLEKYDNNADFFKELGKSAEKTLYNLNKDSGPEGLAKLTNLNRAKEIQGEK